MSETWAVPLAAAFGLASGPLLEAAILATLRRRRAERRPPPLRRLSARAAAISATAAVLEAAAALRLGARWSAPAVAVLVAGLVGLAWSDAQYYLLPKRIQHPMTAACLVSLVVAAGAGGEWHRFLVALGCAAASFGAFLVLNLLNPKAMGFGDVRMAGTIGLVVGWFGAGRTIAAFCLASLLAGAVAAVLLATRRIGARSRLPYGVFLALGALIALLG